MKISNNERIVNIKVCKNFINRFLGLMGKKEITYGVLFPFCNSVHTMFMKSKIDIVLLNNEYEVIKQLKNVKPNRIIWPKKKVKHIMELPINFIDLEIGKKITTTNID